MKCEQIKEHLSAYMDQMTNERESQLIKAHLVGCGTCRQELEQLMLVHALLGSLDAPRIPERFADDLHWRLLKERRQLFNPSEVKRPTKQGWIAAVVAGVALAAGICASSFLPAGTIASLWQDDKGRQDNNTATVAVEDIIQRFQQWRGNDAKPPAAVTVDHGQEGQNPQQPGKPVVDNPSPDNNDISNEASVNVAEVDPQIADVVQSRIKVDSLTDSAKQVMTIAQASGADSWVVPGTTVQAMNGSATREVTIKSPRDQVEPILMKIGGLGSASAPMAGQVELTEQYREAIMALEAIGKEIKNLENQGREEDLPRIEDLKKQSEKWCGKKAQIERDASLVTIKVYLEEEEVRP